MHRPSLLLLATLLLVGCGQPSSEPDTPRVFFESPADGAVVQSPFEVSMGAEGVAVAPAGTMEDGTGHFHIVVDQAYVAAGSVIPADSSHIHYGTAATTATLELAPGQHVLRLQLGDGAHRAIEGLTDEITVTVE